MESLEVFLHILLQRFGQKFIKVQLVYRLKEMLLRDKNKKNA
jgi:hypothetical protein